MENEKNVIRIINDDNIEMEYEVLIAFERIDTGKQYLIYTDHSHDSNGSTNVFASIYVPESDQKLMSITSEEEWDYVERMLRAAQEDFLSRH